MWICKVIGHVYWSSLINGKIYCTRCGKEVELENSKT